MACGVEGRGPADSLARSFELTRGTLGRWLGLTSVSWLLLIPLSAFSGAANHARVRDAALENVALSGAAYDTVVWLATTLFLGLATAVGAAFTTAFYYDCRVRREGLDLRARLAELAAAPRSAA
jgi:hypothetical protein